MMRSKISKLGEIASSLATQVIFYAEGKLKREIFIACKRAESKRSGWVCLNCIQTQLWENRPQPKLLSNAPTTCRSLQTHTHTHPNI